MRGFDSLLESKMVRWCMKNGPYEFVRAPAEYPGKKYRGKYVYEHQLVWWLHTGELIPEGYLIHHKNHNKRDNRFENLEKKKKAEHSREHNLEINPPNKVTLTCPVCAKSFAKNIRTVKWTRKQRPDCDFYCGRSCAARHFGRGRPKSTR